MSNVAMSWRPGMPHTPETRAKIGAAHNQWTARDLGVLRTWYQSRDGKKLDLAGLSRLLGGRTCQLISRKARTLGLTKQSRPTGRKPTAKYATVEERRRAVAEATRKRFAERGHPRGMLGKKKSPEACRAQSKRQMGKKLNLSDEQRQAMSDRVSLRMAARVPTNAYSRCAYGRRDDLDGRFFRSRWEANYARYLNFLVAQSVIRGWEYEADTFWFEAIRRGVRSYKPDFKVTDRDGSVHYDEVKGWMDAKSKTKLARMAKYHPDVDLRLIGERAYYEIERKFSGAIPEWERARKSA